MSDQPAAERLLRARESVAKEFNLADDDWRVRRLALLMCVHSQAEDMAANGRSVDISGLLSLDKAIQEIRESIRATAPMSIGVKFVEGIVGICPKCKAEIPDYKRPEPPPAPPATADTTAPAVRPMPKPGNAVPSKAAVLDTRPASMQPTKPTNVVEISPTMREFNRRHGYSVAKDGGLAKGPATGGIDWLAEPNPAREAAHPLPSPPPECFK